MLTNTGPLADGSIHPVDVKSLREIGKRIREQGWPKAEEAFVPAPKVHASDKDDKTAAAG